MSSEKLIQYNDKGYFLYKGFFNPDEIHQIRNETKSIFIYQMINKGIIDHEHISEDQFEQGIVTLFNEHFDIYAYCGKQAQHLISLHRLSLSEKLVNELKYFGQKFPIISTRPVLYFNKAKLAKAEAFYKVPPHQDWRSMQGSLNSMVVWIPLADIPEDLGALRIIPESHRSGLLESSENVWFRQIDKIDNNDFISVDVEVGDALFFSAFLIHASGNNIKDKIRWSCHFRYNDAMEKTFIKRGYPHPYIYKPIQELITPDFPTLNDLAECFDNKKVNA